MQPKAKITIYPDGSSKIEGLEKTDDCFKLSQLGEAAGKVKNDKKKDHPPVRQDVHANGGNHG